MKQQQLISPIGRELVSRSILITGLGRSGTTLLGKLVASCSGVEYSFEPPLLVSLFSQIPYLQPDSWKLLFDTYLYEEVCVNGLAGRSINLNRHDDSSALKVLGEVEIQRRLSRSWRKDEIEAFVVDNRQVRIACKIPNLVQYIPLFLELYPNVNVVHVVRGLMPTIASLLAKGWFQHTDFSNLTTQIYPYSFSKSIRVPFWVKPDDIDWWTQAAELDRCLYYYGLNISFCNYDQVFRLPYEDLIQAPESTFASLMQHLDLQPGELTAQILQTIHANSLTVRSGSMQLLEQIKIALIRLPLDSISVLAPCIPQEVRD
jgi:hypothetical protein